MYRVLAVDDDRKNLKLIQGFLGDGYAVETAVDGLEAWSVLERIHSSLDVILIDRMMPEMDGMQLTAKIKEHPDMREIPIVMQTAAAHPERIAEGLKAGVYYYLTKPYGEEALVSIVSNAAQDFRKQKALRDQVRKYKKISGMVEEFRLSFRCVREVDDLTAVLANLFPDPERCAVGISELLVNAVEHGNLGINYSAKAKLIRKNEWLEEIARREALPQNASKRVRVCYLRTEKEISLAIRDEGGGFDWASYMEFDPARATDLNGRGIAMSRLVSFDELEYLGKGNEVRCVVHIQGEDL